MVAYSETRNPTLSLCYRPNAALPPVEKNHSNMYMFGDPDKRSRNSKSKNRRSHHHAYKPPISTHGSPKPEA